MATAVGLVVIHEFNYRDNPEQWSTKYWFTGQPPTTPSDWLSLATTFAASEQHCYSPGTKIVGYVGYNDDTPGAHAAWSESLTDTGTEIPGTLVDPAGVLFAGDQAGLLWGLTSRKNSRGKWVYLRKYMHDGFLNANDTDRVSVPTRTAYDTFLTKLRDGTWGGGGHVWRSQKQSENFQNALASVFVTTRTLKRRGKRP